MLVNIDHFLVKITNVPCKVKEILVHSKAKIGEKISKIRSYLLLWARASVFEHNPPPLALLYPLSWPEMGSNHDRIQTELSIAEATLGFLLALVCLGDWVD